jgi:hypothetical protein
VRRFAATAVTACGLLALGVVAAPSPASQAVAAQASCGSGYVSAIIGGQSKCLHAGEFCSPQYETDYERYGFTCVSGRLQSGPPSPSSTTTTTTSTTTATSPTDTSPSSGSVSVGVTLKLGARTRTSSCLRGALPDHRCSPGAYYSGLTQSVVCSSTFRTSTVRNVPESEKHAVEIEYGMPARSYGRTIEIDHIVSLELGGSNDVANLFPEPGSGNASYHAKDKLENKLHALVCSGQMTLAAARNGIASNWETLYTHVFGTAP